jgi:hypothetical protein
MLSRSSSAACSRAAGRGSKELTGDMCRVTWLYMTVLKNTRLCCFLLLPADEQLVKAARKFTGDVEQVPPCAMQLCGCTKQLLEPSVYIKNCCCTVCSACR